MEPKLHSDMNNNNSIQNTDVHRTFSEMNTILNTDLNIKIY